MSKTVADLQPLRVQSYLMMPSKKIFILEVLNDRILKGV
jgi:hypothetical protein